MSAHLPRPHTPLCLRPAASAIRLQSNMTRFAAWMDGIWAFDEALFRLSRAEAVGLDPQCRVLLENTWGAMQVGDCSERHVQALHMGSTLCAG